VAALRGGLGGGGFCGLTDVLMLQHAVGGVCAAGWLWNGVAVCDQELIFDYYSAVFS
jgi:hypothetical protein